MAKLLTQFVALALGCSGSARQGVRDAAADGDASDAGRLEECPPIWDPWGQADVVAWFTDLVAIEYEMQVLAASESEFHLSADPLPENTPTVDAVFPVTPGFDLPSVGDRVLVRGGRCYEFSYVRVTKPDGELIWEGGDPACEEDWVGFFTLRLGVRTVENAEPCWIISGPQSGDCCCPTSRPMDVLVRPEPAAAGGDVLVPGEDREIAIGARRYVARAQGAYDWRDGPCTYDVRDHVGSAFLARLAE